MPHAKVEGQAPLVLATPGAPPVNDECSVFFVGTATVVLSYAGFTLLTDPNFLHAGERVHLGYGLQSTRLTEPACDLASLPPFDFVLLSHLHEDHFDRKVSRDLARATPIITTVKSARTLAGRGFAEARGLAPWGVQDVLRPNARLRITSMPGRHAPGPLAALLPPVMGSMLEFGEGAPPLRVYISGDTVFYPQLAEIQRRYPRIDLALLHLGGTRVLGLTVTMDGEAGVRLMKLLMPRTAIPIHYNDYDRFRSPLEDFRRRAAAADVATEVVYLAHGETHTFRVSPPEGRSRAGADRRA